MDKSAFIVLAHLSHVIAMATIVLSFNSGYNKLAKAGSLITILGLISVLICTFAVRYYNWLNFGFLAWILKNLFYYHRREIVFNVCMWTIYIGGMITFTGSLIRIVQLATDIIPRNISNPYIDRIITNPKCKSNEKVNTLMDYFVIVTVFLSTVFMLSDEVIYTLYPHL